MQSVIISWQVYALTNDKLALGLIGLSEAIPFISTTLFAGYAADIYNRKKILVFSTWLLAACSLLLMLVDINRQTLFSRYGVLPFYGVIGISGIARAFIAPTTQAIQARIIPRGLYSNAATWSSNIFQIGAVSGPLLGGIILEHAGTVQSLALVIMLISGSAWLKSRLPDDTAKHPVAREPIIHSLREGLRFVWHTRPILSSISIDLFAVLFGGVTALLPAFCTDVLHTGPSAMGLLRAAPFMGSALMGLWLVYHPPLKHAGRNLLISVSLFGLCIIGFALSKVFLVSFLLLLLSGAFDNVSVVIRSTIIQLYTPDEMRGRINAVNSVFIKSSNELGDFESGLAARYLGLIPAVMLGGTITLMVVGIAYWVAPSLRRLDLTKDPYKQP